MVKIRPFRDEDTDTLCMFKEESVKANFPDAQFNTGMFREILTRTAKKNPQLVMVAEEDGRIAGYLWLKIITSTVGKFGRFEHLFVVADYRGRGIARQLMQHAEDYCRKHGIKKVKLTVTKTNKDAISLYSSLGYEVMRYRMEKDL